jgi:hypothetical protein
MSASADTPDDEEANSFEIRIRNSIAYTRSCYAQGTTPTACSHFRIHVARDSKVLNLVRNAEEKGLATFIFGSPEVECYSMGIPPQPRYLHEPDSAWFASSSRAEIRAGPIRTDTDVRVAEREVRYQLERRKKSQNSANGKLKLQRDIMVIGLKRQILRLPMQGKLDEKEVRRVMKDYGEELKATESLIESENEESGEEEDEGSSANW